MSETRFPKTLAEKVLGLTEGHPDIQQALGLVAYEGRDTRRASGGLAPVPVMRVPVFVSDQEWIDTPPLQRAGGRL